MPRLFIGTDSNGTPALKITRDSANDPRTTPDSQRNKFAYNSNDTSMAYINDLLDTYVPHGTMPAGWTTPVDISDPAGNAKVSYYPLGSDYMTCQAAARSYRPAAANSHNDRTVYKKSYLENIEYNCPMVSFFYTVWGNDNVFRHAKAIAHLNGDDGYVVYGGNPPSVGPYNATYDGYAILYGVPATGTDMYTYVQSPADDYTYPNDVFAVTMASAPNAVNDLGRMKLLVWNLPGENVPINTKPAITGTSGVKSIKLSPTEFKVAREGYDVDTATADELVFAAEKRPAKILATGEVTITGSGGTFIRECNIPLNNSIVVEHALFATDSAAHFPAYPLAGADWYMTYEAIGSTVKFTNNTPQDLKMRYMIIAHDDQPPTDGTNKVFRKFNDGSQDVIQILRPGADDPPNLADIVIDSRWPSVPILKEGYFDVTVGYDNFLSTTITYSNPDGLLVFVKFAVIRQIGTDDAYFSTAPYIRKVNRGTPVNDQGGDSTYCYQTGTTQITFHTFRGTVINAYDSGYGSPVTYEYDPNPVVGIRYYIFGVPT